MPSSGDIVRAPWSKDQVASLNEFQVSGAMHPFTCGYCRDNYGTRFIQQDDGTLRPETSADWEELSAAFDAGEASELIGRIVVNDRLLVATEAGWTCPTCDYTQDWAWSWMADRTWEEWVWRPA